MLFRRLEHSLRNLFDYFFRTLLECNARRELERARRQLTGDPDSRLTEPRASCCPISIRSAVAHEIGMIEDVESFRSQNHDDALTIECKRPLEEGGHVVDGPALAHVAA